MNRPVKQRRNNAIVSVLFYLVLFEGHLHACISGAASDNKAWPPVFLIGWNKCGTTSLAKTLAQSPRIHLSSGHPYTEKEPWVAKSKEPLFLNYDERVAHGETAYRRMFSNTTGPHVNLDATPTYVNTNETTPNIKLMFPNDHQKLKFVAVMRDPLLRTVSMWHHARRYRNKNQAWATSYLAGFSHIEERMNHALDIGQSDFAMNMLCYDNHLRDWLEQFPITNFCFLSSKYAFGPQTFVEAAQTVSRFYGVDDPAVKFKKVRANTSSKVSPATYEEATGIMSGDLKERLLAHLKSPVCGMEAYRLVDKYGYVGCGNPRHKGMVEGLRRMILHPDKTRAILNRLQQRQDAASGV